MTLVRFILRRDRWRLLAFVLVTAAMTVLFAWTYPESFPTQTEIESRIVMINENPAGVAMTGPGYGLETVTPDNYGPLIANDIGSILAIAVGLLSILTVIRHTRAEDASGRSELIRSSVVGANAPITAAFLVVVMSNLLLALAIGLGLSLFGLPVTGSFAFGIAMAMVGTTFAGIAAAAAQIPQHSGGATAIAGVALAIAFALRALGDVQGSNLIWLSPIGWAQALRPFADEQWWPILLAVGFALIGVAVAFVLNARRDVGAGLRAARPGPSNASDSLGTPLGLAMRLQRGSLIGWSVGLLIGGAYIGLMAGEAESVFADLEIYHDYITVEGASLTDGLLTVFVMWLVLVSAGYAIGAINRLRTEERAGHAEAVLSTAVSRTRYAASILGASLLGTLLAVLMIGIGIGAVRSIETAQLSEFFNLILAALVHLPALWVMIGVALALIGLAPRFLMLIWVFLGYIVFTEMFGPLLGLPDWIYQGSPFRHTPDLPAGEINYLALSLLMIASIALFGLGLLGFRRRDLYA